MATDDRFTIRTPEHVELRFVIAGAGNRFLALVLDTLIQWAAIAILFMAFALALGLLGPLLRGPLGAPGAPSTETLAIWVLAAIVLVTFLLYWGYFTFFETLWGGQTPGKRAMKIRVIREDGRPIGFTEATIRNLLRIVDALPGIYGVGLVVMLLNRHFKRLGDYAAGTVVIRERRRAVPPRGPRLRVSPQQALPAAEANLGRLGREELAMVDAFLRRRDDLDARSRAEWAEKIAVSLLRRLEMRQPVDVPYEAFLEWLGEALRARLSSL